MPKILTIDSSTEACSVALGNSSAFDNTGQIVSRFQHAPRKHAELLLPMVDSVLTEARISLTDIDAIACCVGPGAFTGLRIAISVAQGLAYAAQLPCIAISSLELLAAEAFINSDVNICLSSIDARMQEVYFAGFKKGSDSLPELLHSEQVIAAENIILSSALLSNIEEHSKQPNSIVRTGTGWDEYQYSDAIETMFTQSVKIKYPNAEMMLTIADAHFKSKRLLKPELLQPVYLRNNVARKKSEQK